MDNENIKVGTLMRVYLKAGAEVRLSGVIVIVPEQDTTLLVRIPFFLKGASQVGDFLKSITNAEGRVEVLRE